MHTPDCTIRGSKNGDGSVRGDPGVTGDPGLIRTYWEGILKWPGMSATYHFWVWIMGMEGYGSPVQFFLTKVLKLYKTRKTQSALASTPRKDFGVALSPPLGHAD